MSRFAIASGARPLCCILRGPGEEARHASETLRNIIMRISGACVPLAEHESTPLAENRIVMGEPSVNRLVLELLVSTHLRRGCSQ